MRCSDHEQELRVAQRLLLGGKSRQVNPICRPKVLLGRLVGWVRATDENDRGGQSDLCNEAKD